VVWLWCGCGVAVAVAQRRGAGRARGAVAIWIGRGHLRTHDPCIGRRGCNESICKIARNATHSVLPFSNSAGAATASRELSEEFLVCPAFHNEHFSLSGACTNNPLDTTGSFS